MCRPKPLKTQKLYATITIILRNTASGKIAVGFINTFNSEAVAILTPYVMDTYSLYYGVYGLG